MYFLATPEWIVLHTLGCTHLTFKTSDLEDGLKLKVKKTRRK